MEKKLSRRRFVEAAGAASMVALAGCSNGGGGDGGGEGNETGTGTNETGGLNETNETGTETNETNETNATNETGDAGTEAIRLGGETGGWQGQAPSSIEGETNPTLSLQAEITYDLTWENLDGEEHELIIVDANGNELEASDESEEEGETVTMTVDATEEMAAYYCEYHPETMRGEITVE